MSSLSSGFSVTNEGSTIAQEMQKQPNYTFPKEALAFAVGAVALAILAVVALILPTAAPYGVISFIGLLGGCGAATASASLAYQKNRAKDEYAFAMSIKTEDPQESQKWLEKAATKGCYAIARLELAETTPKKYLKEFLVIWLLDPSVFSTLSAADQARVRTLQAKLQQAKV